MLHRCTGFKRVGVRHREPSRPRDGYVGCRGLALSKDRSTASSEFDAGFGQIADLSGQLFPGLRVNGVHQEHGEVLVEDPELFATLAVGTKVRIFPNHACMTAAAYEVYNVVDGDVEVVDQWMRCNGW